MEDSRKRPSLLLVNPRRKYRYHWDLKEVCEIMGKKNAITPLALPTLAALTPAHYRIRIVDEEIEELDPAAAAPDIVGITALVPNIKRGYELADRYRRAGSTVVMGGPQVSFDVERALEHADAVVVGEAEGAWQRLLADFEAGTLRKVYRNEAVPAFRTQPAPRWDLVDTRQVMSLGVQTSRGCPFSCDFCSVRRMYGERQRYREIDDVIAEIAGLPAKHLTFVDDNLTANKPFARELMRRLKPLRVSWVCQASQEIAFDTELLHAMAEAGCTAILMGFESVNPDNIRDNHKLHNRIELYDEAVRRIHAEGIHVLGAFIVGFENDTVAAFDDIHDFATRNGITYMQFHVLTAYPGTDLYDRMKADGRIAEIDPDLLNGVFPTMQYRLMSQVQLFERYFETLERLLDFDRVREKALRVLGNGAFVRDHDADITARQKLLSFAHLVRRYLLSPDRSRRRLFIDLFRLGRQGTASMSVIVEYLLFVSSLRGYVDFLKGHRGEILEKIRRADRGPFAATGAAERG
jgi:radical SAM superfamily enzyme YgiQ (UPF0313 family)